MVGFSCPCMRALVEAAGFPLKSLSKMIITDFFAYNRRNTLPTHICQYNTKVGITGIEQTRGIPTSGYQQLYQQIRYTKSAGKPPNVGIFTQKFGITDFEKIANNHR